MVRELNSPYGPYSHCSSLIMLPGALPGCFSEGQKCAQSRLGCRSDHWLFLDRSEISVVVITIIIIIIVIVIVIIIIIIIIIIIFNIL